MNKTPVRFSLLLVVLCTIAGCSESHSPPPNASDNTSSNSDETSSGGTEEDLDELTGEVADLALFNTGKQAADIVNAVLGDSYVKTIIILSAMETRRYRGDRIIHEIGVRKGVSSDGSEKKIPYDIRFLRTLKGKEVETKCYYAMVDGKVWIDKRSDADVVAVLGEEVVSEASPEDD